MRTAIDYTVLQMLYGAYGYIMKIYTHNVQLTAQRRTLGTPSVAISNKASRTKWSESSHHFNPSRDKEKQTCNKWLLI